MELGNLLDSRQWCKGAAGEQTSRKSGFSTMREENFEKPSERTHSRGVVTDEHASQSRSAKARVKKTEGEGAHSP